MSLALAALLLGPALSGLAPSSFARDEWYDHYEDALEALGEGLYDQAVDALTNALKRRKRSGYFRTYGNNYVRYVPHYYLGVAHHDRGDCPAALLSFARSDGAEETGSVPELRSRLSSLRASCEARVVAVDDPPDGSGTHATIPAQPPPAPAPLDAVDRGRLEAGLRGYLDGDFERATRIFEELSRLAPDSARLHLLRAMSLHGAWTLDGRRDDAMLQRIRDELRRAARLDPALALDPALCPPNLVGLYRSLR